MCGVVAGVSERNVLPILLEGLKRLEYRGYDSAGISLVSHNKIKRVRVLGKVKKLIEELKKQEDNDGKIGLAHTRWATHGAPTKKNSHPHLSASGKIAIVHNGIIENFSSLKENLINQGTKFASETDTEVVVHLLERNWDSSKSFVENVRIVINMLKGAYGLVIMHVDFPHSLVTVRSGSPIIIGLGIGENFISSDSLSLSSVTDRFAYLEEGDIALIERDNIELYDCHGVSKPLKVKRLLQADTLLSKGSYKHYMQKEIFEQPSVILETFMSYVDSNNNLIMSKFSDEAKKVFLETQCIKIVACGTSFHAAIIAKYWLEEKVKIPVDIEIASEFRYRNSVVREKTLFIAVSQSGETADTLAALLQAKKNKYFKTFAICNVANSSLVRETDFYFITKAGVEMGVASTKAFTTQLVAFLLLTVALTKSKRLISEKDEQNIFTSLKRTPSLIEHVLSLDKDIERLSFDFVEKNKALFLGRGIQYAVALEGALKLKEISYIHAEAYPAGELKHGPLALVDKDMPIIVVIPNDHLLKKLESNLQEVEARGGNLYVFADYAVNKKLNIKSKKTFFIESIDNMIAPIIFTIPLQLFAYHVAVQKGTDVDQPRNLAKSVTVE